MCADIKKKVRQEGYPVADNVMERGVLLPVHHAMNDLMYKRLHNKIKEFIEKNV